MRAVQDSIDCLGSRGLKQPVREPRHRDVPIPSLIPEKVHAKLSRRIILAQEKERSRISQVIHSDFGQSLVTMKMLVAMSTSRLSEEGFQVKPILESIGDSLSQIIEKCRNLSHELAPPSLKHVGLVSAIKELVESTSFKSHLKIRFFHRNLTASRLGTRDIMMFRIVQEALQNVLKHSKGTKAVVKANYQDSVYSLEVSDNGIGFDQVEKANHRGLGLALMRKQVELIHGTMTIESHPGEGTSIKVAVPLRKGKVKKRCRR